MHTSSQAQTPNPNTAKSQFGPAHVLHSSPDQKHTHTMIMLHGRGTDAEDFAEELMTSTLSDGRSLYDSLPGWRWVFPSSREVWSTTFEEYLPSWFEAHSLTHTKARQDLQMEGIRASVEYIQSVLDEEVARLDGENDKVYLGGISQGGAVGIWTLLCQADPARLPGAFVGASTWVPFDQEIEQILSPNSNSTTAARSNFPYDDFVQTMLASRSELGQQPHMHVFLGHGTDDAYVNVKLGQAARKILSQAGCEVQWRKYSGAEQEGHWFQVPDEMDDILDFLRRVSS